ncbi:alpha/beta fold hydrolase [Streptomyces cavernae]|uniref:alpha/beta fold hydrolase n=1 Tax=Streptomyces cavernae TaxID=2259034 RepID=UPI000FEBB365|nr:alpha/beta hydrolase [Streptomyces cavernae]
MELTTVDGVSLAYRDHRPAGRTAEPAPAEPTPAVPVLLLHGLAGHMGEWDALTDRLLQEGADAYRVVRYDARGHGDSTLRPSDMSRAATVRDAVALIRDLGLAPVTLIGQSLGGLTALLVAANHPELVRSLVLIEAGPAGADAGLPARIAGWLDGWPTPFRTFAEATAFFGHEAWARGLEQRPDGWYARVDRDTMIAAVAEPAERSYWAEWDRIRCPVLVIRGARGTQREAETAEMRTRRPGTTRIEVAPDAGHDVHLDRPDWLYETIRTFLPGME